MVVLIPAYEPDTRLLTLVADLRTAGHDVLVVDDGSGPDHAPLFAAATRLGAHVLTHPRNRGKGQALRTGLAHLAATRPGQDVVCADCDGQHTPTDIDAVAARLAAVPDDTLVLGTRRFTGDVPTRSRVGNTVTRLLFRAVTGTAVHDTQTGLRGYPAAMIPWLLGVRGDRFEYELEILLRATTSGRRIVEHDIATVYLHANASSHFRPVADSLRVYLPLLAFAASSLTAFVLDTVLLLALHATTGNLLLSVIGARAVSCAVNFHLNRRLVFGRTTRAAGHTPRRGAAARYAALALTLLTANYLLLTALTTLGVPLLTAKVLTEATLFATSFEVQRRFVFTTGTLPTMSPARTTPRGKAPQCPSTPPARPTRPQQPSPAPPQPSSPTSDATSHASCSATSPASPRS
ncbi:glycosyltransferase [Cellulomonas soli]